MGKCSRERGSTKQSSKRPTTDFSSGNKRRYVAESAGRIQFSEKNSHRMSPFDREFRLFPIEGHDSVLGGAGDDRLYGDPALDTLDGGTGTNEIIGFQNTGCISVYTGGT